MNMFFCAYKLTFLNKLFLLTDLWGFFDFYEFLMGVKIPICHHWLSVVTFRLVINLVWLLTHFLYLFWWVSMSVASVGGRIDKLMAGDMLCIWNYCIIGIYECMCCLMIWASALNLVMLHVDVLRMFVCALLLLLLLLIPDMLNIFGYSSVWVIE